MRLNVNVEDYHLLYKLIECEKLAKSYMYIEGCDALSRFFNICQTVCGIGCYPVVFYNTV